MLLPIIALVLPMVGLTFNIGETSQKINQLCYEYQEHKKEHDVLNNKIMNILERVISLNK